MSRCKLEPREKVRFDTTIDCVRWNSSGYLACASYELLENTRERKGQIAILAQLESLQSICSINLPGVFEMKWLCGVTDKLSLMSAAADGNLHLIKFNPEENVFDEHHSIGTTNTLGERCAYCLYCDFSKTPKVICTRSDGKIAQVDLESAKIDFEWLGHSYPFVEEPAEVWCAVYDIFNNSVVFSGADDGILKLWDLRQKSTSLLAKNVSAHRGGVCCIQFHPERDSTFATGSYDNCIRIWDKRNLKSPTLEPVNAKGGVWRIRWHPQHHSILLAACMRGGFRVYDIRLDGKELFLCDKFANGFANGTWEALAYDIDCSCSNNGVEMIYGASFYDKTVWSFALGRS